MNGREIYNTANHILKGRALSLIIETIYVKISAIMYKPLNADQHHCHHHVTGFRAGQYGFKDGMFL
jgi:hypothetical protein